MADDLPSTDVDLARRIDQMCDRFEGNWRLGRRQNFGSYVFAAAPQDRESCFTALLELELDLRRQEGESPTQQEYLDRFPAYSGIVRRVVEAGGSTDSLVAGEATLDSRSAQTGDGQGKKEHIRQKLPTQFGRYQVKSQIGAGGMGTVVLAEDTLLGRPVALKIPYLTGASDQAQQEQLERFDREARTSAILRHPNICPIYDVGQVDGVRYISMAYIEGATLFKHVTEAQLDERAIARLICKLAEALQDAHENGVVHRDLKPANIMVDRKGEPIIMDFGLALRTQCETDVRLTQSGFQMGSPAYMPPEQVDGDMERIGPASDIYSLGVVLYELLTGHVPFDGSTASIFAQIIMKDPIRPSSLRVGLSAELEAICLKMMAKRIEERYASMSDVAAALSKYVTGHPAFVPTTDSVPQPAVTEGEHSANQSPANQLAIAQAEQRSPKENQPADLQGTNRKDSTYGLRAVSSKSASAASEELERVSQDGKPATARSSGTREAPKSGTSKTSLSPETELRLLTLDINNSLKNQKIEGLLANVERFLLLQPDNPAILGLRERLQNGSRINWNPKGSAAPKQPDSLKPSDDASKQPPAWRDREASEAVSQQVAELNDNRLPSLALEDPLTTRADVQHDLPAKQARPQESPSDRDSPPRTIAFNRFQLDQWFDNWRSRRSKSLLLMLMCVVILGCLLIVTRWRPFSSAASKSKDRLNSSQSSNPTTELVTSPSGSALSTSGSIANRSGAKTAKPQVSPGADSPSSSASLPPILKSKSTDLVLILIPEGEFWMGAEKNEKEASNNERPRHRVRQTRPFYLGKYEVTQQQFQTVMGMNPSAFQPVSASDGVEGKFAQRCPVEQVSWNDAVDFCNKLSELDGLTPCYDENRQRVANEGYRLPTEAEWEYACRAGTTTPFHFGESVEHSQANFSEDVTALNQEARKKVVILGKTTTVGDYVKNAFGLYDMHGNVFEWCEDLFDEKVYASRSGITLDPVSRSGSEQRVLRGGSWRDPAKNIRSAFRFGVAPEWRAHDIGFRILLPSGSGNR